MEISFLVKKGKAQVPIKMRSTEVLIGTLTSLRRYADSTPSGEDAHGVTSRQKKPKRLNFHRKVLPRECLIRANVGFVGYLKPSSKQVIDTKKTTVEASVHDRRRLTQSREGKSRSLSRKVYTTSILLVLATLLLWLHLSLVTSPISADGTMGKVVHVQPTPGSHSANPTKFISNPFLVKPRTLEEMGKRIPSSQHNRSHHRSTKRPRDVVLDISSVGRSRKARKTIPSSDANVHEPVVESASGISSSSNDLPFYSAQQQPEEGNPAAEEDDITPEQEELLLRSPKEFSPEDVDRKGISPIKG